MITPEELENHEFPISRYLSQKAARMSSPLNGIFELTGRCNFNCKMCYVHNQSQQDVAAMQQKELSVSQWVKIAEQAREAGLVFLLLTGGEAMLRKDFLQLYQKLSTMGFRLVINSNGSLLTQSVLDCFSKYPPARVNVSVYGASNESYQSLCGVSAHDRVVQGIHALRQMDVPVRILMTITPDNVQDMEAVYALSRQEETLIEMTSYCFPPIRLHDNTWGENCARFSAEEAGKVMAKRDRLLLQDDQKFAEKGRMMLTQTGQCLVEGAFPEEEHIGEPSSCGAARNSFWITWDGKMRPCGLMDHPQANVLEVGFDAAWQQMKKEIEKIRLPYECRHCPDKELCRPCAAMCLCETGHWDRKPEYLCRMVHSIKEEYRYQLDALQREAD